MSRGSAPGIIHVGVKCTHMQSSSAGSVNLLVVKLDLNCYSMIALL